MNQNKLFNQTRLRLAVSYAAVMGVILLGLGLGVYKAIAHAHWVALDQELESVAETLHDSVRLKLQQPGKLDPAISELLPNFCLVGTECPSSVSPRDLESAVFRNQYYIRIYDPDGRLVATAGDFPDGLPQVFNSQPWQTLVDRQGEVYHQLSLKVQTRTQEYWGYFQVGRSTKHFNDYLGVVKLALKLGLPISLMLVVLSSWWLAGLAMQPIYQSYRQIQQFTADAAHELRTPLAATQATIESALLTPELEEKEALVLLKTIQRQNRRLTQLVSDLLLLARMDRQVLLKKFQICCLPDLVTDLVEEFAVLAKEAQVILREEIKLAGGLRVKGDEDQLYRLVSNLIVNGINYTPPGGSVTVVLDRRDAYAVIQVKDTGIGIPVAEQKRIFDRFYRVDSARGRTNGGSGLGLAIALAITQAHHGKLSVESELNQGSVFTLLLPVK